MDQLLADINVAFPRASISSADIRLVHRGLLPATESSARRVTLLRESPFVDHGEDGCGHLFSLVGVRYTTARHSAERAVDAMCRALDVPAPPSATATTKLDGGAIEQFDTFLADAMRQARPGLPAALIARLVRTYGTAWADVVGIGADLSPPDTAERHDVASTVACCSHSASTARSRAPKCSMRCARRWRSRWPMRCCDAPKPARAGIPVRMPWRPPPR